MHHLLRTCWAAIGRDGTLVGGVGVVTPVCGNVVPGTSLDDGLPDEDLLVVGLYDTGSVARTCDFSFVVYPLA